jgi:hypothetical protein
MFSKRIAEGNCGLRIAELPEKGGQPRNADFGIQHFRNPFFSAHFAIRIPQSAIPSAIRPQFPKLI